MSDAMPSNAPPPPMGGSAGPITVVGPQFVAAHPVDLIITKKLMTLKDNSIDIAITDVNGNVKFKIKGLVFNLHLFDNADQLLVCLRQKIFSAHRKWHVYRGDSSDPKDLLFTVKKSSILQFKTQLDVFLAQNTSEDVPDFKIKGSWSEKSCTIYLGNSSTVIAQMHKKHNSVQSIMLGKDSLAVTAHPNVDYAFIVSLIVVLYESNEDGKRNSTACGSVLSGLTF